LVNTVLLSADFKDGLAFYEVSPEVSNMWLAAFQEFQSSSG
jgi:hypothetical protein